MKRQPAQAASVKDADDGVALDLGPDQPKPASGVFHKPPGPPQGGVIKVPHPGAAQGLIRINEDGTYQYRTQTRAKHNSGSFQFGIVTAPNIQGEGKATYTSIYGGSSLMMFSGDYEFQPVKASKNIGLQLGAGIGFAQGHGILAVNPAKDGTTAQAKEKYTLYVVPVSVFGVYHFQYSRKQAIVPYLKAGGTYYAMLETRDDNATPHTAGAEAIGGGGGIMFSISRLDPNNAATINEEYGIAGMWLTLEAKVMQGLNAEKDFSNKTITGGITVDF